MQRRLADAATPLAFKLNLLLIILCVDFIVRRTITLCMNRNGKDDPMVNQHHTCKPLGMNSLFVRNTAVAYKSAIGTANAFAVREVTT